eukprot:1159409-Pelagomonas_calceolata.AAC.5
MDSALHILSVCQCPAIRNMVTERHNIVSRMVLKVVSGGSHRSNLVHVDLGRLAQHDLHITEQVSNRVLPPDFFNPSIPDLARHCVRVVTTLFLESDILHHDGVRV